MTLDVTAGHLKIETLPDRDGLALVVRLPKLVIKDFKLAPGKAVQFVYWREERRLELSQ